MGSVEKAYETQLKNIQAKTGKTLEGLYAMIRKSGLSKHGEIRDMLKRDLRLGHGDANTLVTFFLKARGEGAGSLKGGTIPDVVNEIYSGPKARFRPIHDRLIVAISTFGEFEIAPKKGYVSLRRKKQFAMIGPVTTTRVEVGLNMKGVKATARLIEMPPGGMCQFKVSLTDVSEVDNELIAWIKQAFNAAG